ncbi:PIG-L deacetylase family protein [Mesorhizobium sp. M0578]|uniref:PIG-L deacetylase family protein n=1 Tax=unclassified Mesorhizobium TaxID=325217 RepID=UPI003339A0FF
MKVLALGAHPDDIEIFMFGTMAAYAALGAELTFVVATDGARGGKGDPVTLARTRREEATIAASLLGIAPRFLDFPDGALVADAALIAALKTLIGEVKPDLAITHARNDYHGDHRALSDGVRIAASFAAPVLHADTLGGSGFSPTTTSIFPPMPTSRRERFARMARSIPSTTSTAHAHKMRFGPANATALPARWPKPSDSNRSFPSPTYARSCLRRRRSGYCKHQDGQPTHRSAAISHDCNHRKRIARVGLGQNAWVPRKPRSERRNESTEVDCGWIRRLQSCIRP